MEVKKSEKADLRKNITLYALSGLAFMLLLSWQGLEYESRTVEIEEVFEEPEELFIEEEIPITQMLDTPPPPPPPPPAPEVIEIVEDDVEIEEVIIEDTETDEQEEIVEIEEVAEEVGVEEVIADVPFAIIENVPIYPGCEDMKNNADRKKCMSEKITKFVNRKFNTGLAQDLGLEGRQKISVQFKIDSKGNVVGIKSKAKHPRLQEEAARVINELPSMTPGMQRGKPVGVIYALPIIFQVQD
ncbi:protein TonB [Nonlabens dokdonensis]|jgi:protein TonB|uniref:TonB family protein n=2 Tax=Nonlabens dokdonensis TaxID=328515 RepID=L7W7R4_NONDD|nr:energy transducer TonB [Nonlabens dokdonensis]AGC76199.1 TonB family protein [Nonlabens dokdonensis DSW-6]PZX43868.1 protein TonB [Nonlabens dokdonensis]